MATITTTNSHTTGLTDAEILALSNQTFESVFTSTTGKTYKVDSNGIPVLETNIVIVKGESNNGFLTESIIDVTTNNGIITIDASGSKFNGDELGASIGLHRMNFIGTKNKLNLLGANTTATLTAVQNMSLNGSVWEKSIAGNVWDAAIYSNEYIDTDIEDGAFVWEINNITGTIREMAGLASSTSDTFSYTSLNFGIFQINNYVNRAYELGPNYLFELKTLQVGDFLGVRVENRVVTYFHMRGTVVTDLYVSSKLAEGKLHFKYTANIGVGSSGHSTIGSQSVKKIASTSQQPYNVTILGGNTFVSEEDKSKLNNVGMSIESSSKYNRIDFSKLSNTRHNDSNGNPYDIELRYNYIVPSSDVVVVL